MNLRLGVGRQELDYRWHHQVSIPVLVNLRLGAWMSPGYRRAVEVSIPVLVNLRLGAAGAALYCDDADGIVSQFLFW